MLEGITVKHIQKILDERGWFVELLRKDWSDWKELFGNDEVVQVNHSFSYQNVVRAWHMHQRGQNDYFLVLSGTAKICAYDDKTRELDEVYSSEDMHQIVKVPGKYWHGFKVVGNTPTILLYFVNKLYDYKSPDEVRRPWNDPTIVPLSINGNTKDSRCGKPWDWFSPPYK
jgi:dTDP-4-dehydrorhamnose 3,5-epimerase